MPSQDKQRVATGTGDDEKHQREIEDLLEKERQELKDKVFFFEFNPLFYFFIPKPARKVRNTGMVILSQVLNRGIIVHFSLCRLKLHVYYGAYDSKRA